MWDASTFSKNRERLLEGDIAAPFLATLMARPRVKRLLSSDHFSIDGTMIQAWSSMKSIKPIGQDDNAAPPPASGSGRNAEADFHGETRTNATHASTTDPEAKLYKKSAGTEASIAPQMLLRAMLLQAFYSVRSERPLMERSIPDRGVLPLQPVSDHVHDAADHLAVINTGQTASAWKQRLDPTHRETTQAADGDGLIRLGKPARRSTTKPRKR